MPNSPSAPVRNGTLAPKDVKEWLLPEPSSMEIDETVGPIRARRCAATRPGGTHASAMTRSVRVRMRRLLRDRARACRDYAHFISNPTTIPAAFMRASHDHAVAM